MIDESGARVGDAPRVSEAQIDAVIPSDSVQYHRFPGTTVTVCCITLINGYAVLGESACVSPENFDEELGRRIAYNAARDKIWPLEGYRLRVELSEREGNAPER